jgi:hypothetical protein
VSVAAARPLPSAPASAPAKPGSRWIVSRGQDLVWLHGSALVGVALVLAFLALPPLSDAGYALTHPAVLLVFLWGALVDGPHVWGTYARTYAAPRADQAARAGLPGAWSWGLVLLGPLVAGIDYALLEPGPSLLGQAGFLFQAFLGFAYVWAFWHLVRQHYGFLALYRRKAGEDSRAGARLDAAILWVGASYPFLRYSLSPAFAQTGLPQLTPEAWVAPLRLALDVGAGALLLGLVGLALSGRVERFRLGPKHLLLATVVVFHGFVFWALDHLLAITAALTIYHNLQYQRIVWQYEAGRGRRPSGSLAAYLALGVVVGVVWYGPRILGVAATDQPLVRNLLLGLGWGVAFHHYLVDGRIWKVRRAPGLGRTLDRGAAA